MNYPEPASTYVERKLQERAQIKRMQDAGSKLAMYAIIAFVVVIVFAQIIIHYAEAIRSLLGGF